MDEKELSIQEFDLKKHFIDYWDEVVRQWLKNDADYSKFKDEVKEQKAKEQSQIINAINDMFRDQPEYRLNTIHMPEPYWGDPRDCSIVLLDYNPAGGPRVNRHTTISCKSCTGCDLLSDEDKKIIPSMTFIKYVDGIIKDGKKGYSDIALTGPVFKAKKGLEWFWDADNGYEGYDWWQQKCGWLDHLVEVISGEKDEKKLPFAMELCGWHSQKWNNDMSWIEKGQCRTIINNRSILPLFAALKNSTCKMAVCIGAEFRYDWLEKFFKDKVKDVTKALSDIFTGNDELKKSYDIVDKDGKVVFADLTYTVEYDGKENIYVVAKWNEIKKKKGKVRVKPVNRNYRVFKISEGDESYYLLNTNYRGSNGHPAEHFWKFEELLITEIKNLDKSCKTGVNT